MRRKTIATLLIAGWIILSGFDVLEDFRSSGRAAVSKLAHDRSSTPTIRAWGMLANNIVESAFRLPQACFYLVDSSGFTATPDALPDFRAYRQLHKLYRVFLI